MQRTLSVCAILLAIVFTQRSRAEIPAELLSSAGDNRAEIEQALAKVPADQRAGLEFLILNMPPRDLMSLSADFLLENTRLAYQSRRDDPWAKEIPEDIFLGAVLPYASINERRDNWRADFRKRFLPLVKNAKSPSEAAALLNQMIFGELKVKYSTQRKKADQSPYESMEIGLASCTGLSVLLIDACRSVGVPARMVGTPLWANNSGNHSWVEIWDDGWHFTGAAEPTGDELNRGWFVANASKGVRDDPLHAIYATSFKKTPLSFPCVWDPRIDYIPAVNVTDRYVELNQQKPEGHVDCLFVARKASGERVAAEMTIVRDGETIFAATTNDERFDANDHRRVWLPKDAEYLVRVKSGDGQAERTITPTKDDELFTFTLQPAVDSPAIKSLKQYLQTPADERKPLGEQQFAKESLNSLKIAAARNLLAEDRLSQVRQDRKEEFESRVITHDDLKMPFFFKRFGEKPAEGWSLYISLHGGGGAPAALNDQQWENQKRLYDLKEGIYLAPRAPTNTWDLWHQAHIDPMFTQLIEDLVAFEGVNRNRIYVMGYSAGGDGVYQLAPRMSDRWAAAAMMAGHPNETSPIGLRNVPFALQVGGRDAAYKRNEVARDWEKRLDELEKADPDGYKHLVNIYPNKGHWMDREDAIAIPWMAEHERNPTPTRIVWRQDNVTHGQFYWLGVDEQNRKAGSEIIAQVDAQTITLTARDVKQLTVYLDDRFIDLEKPVTIVSEGKVLFEGPAPRTLATLADTFAESRDPLLAFPAAVTVEIPPAFPAALVPAEEIPKYTAVRTEKPITIDGKLDEAAWQSATKTPAFVDLISGEKTQHDTRAAILWDNEFLYIGFWVAEPNVDAKYKERDDPIYYDNDIEVFIAGKYAYYEFEMNALGTIYEAFFIWDDAYDSGGYAAYPQLKRGVPKSQPFNGVGLKHHPRGQRTAYLGYDFPGLKSAVHIDGTLNDDSDTDKGWTAELAFPWKSMAPLAAGDKRSLPPQPGDQWQIDLFRFNKYKAPAPAKDSGGWALGRHAVWDSHIPEIFPVVTFAKE